VDILVAYDIADTAGSGARRLREVADVCSAYGQRVHLSIFECRVSPAALEQLKNRLLEAIDPRVDSVLIYRFPSQIDRQRTILGRGPNRGLGAPWIL
jgi:CRISPR-associated protein Cas2